MKKTIKLGALAPKLGKQFPGIPYMNVLQADADAINRLRIRGFLWGSETAKLHKHLVKMIEAELKAKSDAALSPGGVT